MTVTNMSDKLGFSTEAARIPAVLKFRANAAETYTTYRVNAFISASDAIIIEQNDRFSMQQNTALCILTRVSPIRTLFQTTARGFL